MCAVVDERIQFSKAGGRNDARSALSSATAALQQSSAVVVWASAAYWQATAVWSGLLESGYYWTS